MKDPELRYSVTAVAGRLHTTQPPLSQQIRKLERHLKRISSIGPAARSNSLMLATRCWMSPGRSSHTARGFATVRGVAAGQDQCCG
ncbi:hypothetical protein DIJ64_14775 [Mycobacterium leprae]|uniref:HTH lysR-type domain-containing protein n=1 Tax=Mycobacterium leprae TaxID=1769 RepID=A0AAD0KU92_MYCLR|nr:hypothetical protein DIJ64_14775 [Mycobacterium leprae]